MITKIEHIGIAVKDPKKSNEIFEKLLGHTSFKSELIESQGVKTHFYQVGESKIELLEATSDKSPINKYLQKRGEGMHHLALHVDNIHLELERLTNLGFETIGEVSKGADNKLICFLNPKSTSGVLIELCQELNQL
jgi:methylmalonyl-CoA/ethylmalonyl-CoA epimerase